MSLLSENCYTIISRNLIPNPDLDFWAFDPKSSLGQIWAQQFKVVRFVSKLVHIVFQGCWFQMQTYIFQIPTPKSNFGQIWVRKFIVFVWKLVHIVSQGCRLQIWTWIFEIPTQNPFLRKFSSKSQICSLFLKIGTHGILTMLILIPTLVFWISNPKSIFWQIWAKKVKVVCFAWKLVHMLSRGCWFLFQH